MGARAPAVERLMLWLWRLIVFAILTALTQIGGVAWLLAVAVARNQRIRIFLAAFLAIYVALWVGTRFAAPSFNRIAVPCIDNGPSRARALSPIYCALNRTYVTPELLAQVDDLAAHMHETFPGTRTRVLDGGFPFPGVPLLPHLSHNDGTAIDLAFWYEGGNWRSPIGYWAFEEPGPQDPDLCGDSEGLSLRWNMGTLQPFMRDLPLDEPRTAEALNWLAANLPEGSKVFIEPHLADRLGVTGDKIRFQGCRAARHDDHIHVQF